METLLESKYLLASTEYNLKHSLQINIPKQPMKQNYSPV